jgi:hypothetical protein
LSSETLAKHQDDQDSPGEQVIDLSTVQPWHGLPPALIHQMLGEALSAAGVPPCSLGHTDRDLTAREAATMLRLTKPDGSPRDSFYKLAPALGGYRVTGGWRFPRAGIETYRKNGGK